MEIILHRVNTIKELRKTPKEYGTEIDIRAYGSNLILNHEAFQTGDRLEDYLDEFTHGTLILNIKEAGIEDEVLRQVRLHHQINSYFLLDVEFPYLYLASRNSERSIAVRFSEDESIETVKKYVDAVDWIWIDTNTKLPINEINLPIVNKFKKCLVCPERWGRASDIENYKKIMYDFKFSIDAVMTQNKYSNLWLSKK
jgi:hypothetical protein